MSSPARSLTSGSIIERGQGINSSNLIDENSIFHLSSDLTTSQERKEEALAVLRADVMAALEKEVKSLDEDNWKFAAPRSQINLISKPRVISYNHGNKLRQ